MLRYWLVRTEHLVHEDWIPYRISLLGNYGTDLVLKREINRFLISEDPYGTVSFVRFGLERRELRKDMDIEMIVSIHRLDGGTLPGCAAYGGTRSRTISAAGRIGGKERSADPAVSGGLAAGDRNQHSCVAGTGAAWHESIIAASAVGAALR